MTGGQIFAAFIAELRQGMNDRPVMLMIAGPNGAGKTTLWYQVLKDNLGPYFGERYINADEIEREQHVSKQRGTPAEGGSRFAQTEAAARRIALLKSKPALHEPFVFETVFSDPEGRKLQELEKGCECGYFVVMVFVGVDNVELTQQRVRARVERGGHDVPTDKQIERFPRVYSNAAKAVGIVDLAMFTDNTRDAQEGRGTHRPIAVCKSGAVIGQLENMPSWWAAISQ